MMRTIQTHRTVLHSHGGATFISCTHHHAFNHRFSSDLSQSASNGLGPVFFFAVFAVLQFRQGHGLFLFLHRCIILSVHVISPFSIFFLSLFLYFYLLIDTPRMSAYQLSQSNMHALQSCPSDDIIAKCITGQTPLHVDYTKKRGKRKQFSHIFFQHFIAYLKTGTSKTEKSLHAISA